MRLFRNTAALSLGINLIYAVLHCVVGVLMPSWWFLTLGAYYIILSVSRLSILIVRRRCGGDVAMERFAQRVTGILFLFLALCMSGVVILTIADNRGTKHHEILMITIAVYAFTKVTLAIIGLVRSKNDPSPAVKTLRNVTFADAFVSIYSLQRSMLVSFPGMLPEDIRLFNILTGTGVCLLILILGLNLIGGKYITMAKSKLTETNKRIAAGVVGGYKKIEKGVVGGYKKIEKGVVEGYTKIEDRFVESYLARDGETVEEAKQRLREKK